MMKPTDPDFYNVVLSARNFSEAIATLYSRGSLLRMMGQEHRTGFIASTIDSAVSDLRQSASLLGYRLTPIQQEAEGVSICPHCCRDYSDDPLKAGEKCLCETEPSAEPVDLVMSGR